MGDRSTAGDRATAGDRSTRGRRRRPAARPTPGGSVLAALAALVAAGVTAATARAQPGLPPTGFEAGERFPALSFPTLEGDGAASVADLRGHKAIVHVFASW